jgi:hypothetical protein
MTFASGLLTTFADKLFKTEGKKVNDLRDAFVSAAGGIGELNRKAVAAGITLDALLKAKTVKDYEAAIAALNTKLEKTAALQGELAGLQQQLADRSVMNWKTAEEAAGRYGITLEALGPKFSGAKLHDDFLSLWNDWQTLIDMGADAGGVLAGMSDEISGFVQRSIALGTEVPEQFRTLIEELIRTGQLLDANGDAITDMSAIKFGPPLVSEVDKIITAIDKLIAALTDHLIPTIGKIPSQLRIKVGYDYEDYEPREGGGRSAVPMAAGGDFLVTRPTLFLAGEAGPERARFSGAGKTDFGGSDRPIAITLNATIISKLDGKEVARNQVRYLPDELLLAGR